MIARMALVASGMRLMLERKRDGVIGGNENDMMAESCLFHINSKCGCKGEDYGTRVDDHHGRVFGKADQS
jgi:hypothetical protein